MKKLFKNTNEINIKNFIIVAIQLLSIQLYGQENLAVAVGNVEGNAFYSIGGKTRVLKTGMQIPSGADIFTEEGAQLSFYDYFNHQFTLSGSGQLTVYSNKTMLKAGYLWVQTRVIQNETDFQIMTANAEIEYGEGEGIVSFDPYSGKTQLLVLRGDYVFKNTLYKENYVNVRDGRFSFISNDVNSGLPRKPTPIGYGSFKKITGLFNGVQTLEEQNKGNAQKIASTETVGKDVYINVPKQDAGFEQALGKAMVRAPSSENKDGKINTEVLLNDYLKELAKDENKADIKSFKGPASEKKSIGNEKIYKGYRKNSVNVNIYGSTSKSVPKLEENRIPASSHPVETKVYGKAKDSRTPASLGNMLPEVHHTQMNMKSFESKLNQEYHQQQRHSDEMNTLIDKLRSVDMDYKKDY